jgi:hypothetical protein
MTHSTTTSLVTITMVCAGNDKGKNNGGEVGEILRLGTSGSDFHSFVACEKYDKQIK